MTLNGLALKLLRLSGICLLGPTHYPLSRLVQDRIGDLSEFVKEIKQTYLRYFNTKYHCRGTLWGERFKSLIVENGETPVKSVALVSAKISRGRQDFQDLLISFLVKRWRLGGYDTGMRGGWEAIQIRNWECGVGSTERREADST